MINRSLQKILHGIVLSGLMVAGAHAQTADSLLAFRFPELAGAINAAEVAHAAILEEIVLTDSSAQSDIGKDLLRESLAELAAAKGSHYHTAGNHLAMLGPYRVFESRATPGLLSMLREDFSRADAEQAVSRAAVLPPHATAVLQRGQKFQSRLIEIYLDGAVIDKEAAVDAAVAEYLTDDRHSVPAKPKSSELLSKHPHAYAFRVGFPQLSGLNWASQWLQLATLEILIMSALDGDMATVGIERAMELYVEKIARQHGNLMSLPSDIPTVPVIAPNIYSAHPQAAIIIDNLSALKIVLSDILAHPDVDDRAATISAMLAQFTDKENHLDSEIDYLTFVLRGGIFNQGGPAFGGMQYSERNRSRESLDGTHVTRLPMGVSF
jgi:hypothetical protein